MSEDLVSALERLIAEMRDRANYDFNITARAKELILGWTKNLDALLAECERLRAENDHSSCHDAVCNSDGHHPRGAKGISCSCKGRDDAYQKLQVAETEIAQLKVQQTWDAVCRRLALILEPQCVLRDGNRVVHWCDVESAFGAGSSPSATQEP